MLCRHCHSEQAADDAYCTACGKPLGLACAACGHLNRADSRFCGKCSAPLQQAAAVTPAADVLLRALSARGGERKRLTVLFADIVESTRLVGEHDPEDALNLLQPAIEAMKDAVDRHGGVVVRVQGDGILALFGAPVPHEDHALRACVAALAMQTAIAGLGDSPVKIRVGLNTDVVVTQAVENSLAQLTYDVAGPAAHLAARMEQMAQAGEVLMTAATMAATRQSVEATSLGLRTAKGFAEPVEVFRLLGIRHAPASVIFRSRPRLSRLAGRTTELEALNRELANSANGDARAIGVAGIAGAGKSRLCFEFAESCRNRGIHIYEARVLAHARATPYQPVLELLRDYLGLKPGQSAEVARRQVMAAARSLVREDTLPLLLDFLGLAAPDNPPPKLDPAVRKARLLDVVRGIVRSGRRNEPAVILVEDLHWIDPASAEFIEAMVGAVANTTTMLLFNYRPEFQASWMQLASFRPLAVRALDRQEMAGLLDGLLGHDPSLAQLRLDIAERAQGNPFFAEELIQSLVERGHLEGAPTAYRLAHEIDAIPLPTTIEALLGARIDRLDESAKRVLQCAAVIGREVPAAVLGSVAGLSPEELAEPLVRLRRVELLRELSVDRPGLHAFSHPLVQEVCYRSLLRERRRRIHGQVAQAFKTQSSDPWEARTSLLAYHLEEAGELLEAAQATMRTAMWASAHDSAQALRSWRKVHGLLANLPVSEQTDFMRMHTCIQIMSMGWREGLAMEEVQGRFEEARRIALASGNLRANAWVHGTYGRNLAVAGSASDYVARVKEALALAAQADDRSSAATLTAMLSQALRLSGAVREALTTNSEAIERAGDISEFDRQLFGIDVERWLTAMRGQILVMLRRFDEARACLDRLLQAETDPRDIVQHLANFAYIDLAWGENDRALAQHHADQVQALATASGSPYVQVHAHAGKGTVHMMSGQFDEAREELAKGLAFARSRSAGLEMESRLLTDLARAHVLAGDLDSGRRVAREAIDVATARAARVSQCVARIVRAEILLKSGDAKRARRELSAIEALMEETGATLYRPLVSSLATELERQGVSV